MTIEVILSLTGGGPGDGGCRRCPTSDGLPVPLILLEGGAGEPFHYHYTRSYFEVSPDMDTPAVWVYTFAGECRNDRA